MNLSNPDEQQWRYFDLQPWQRRHLVKVYHDAFGDDELWREWRSGRNWAVVFFVLGGCFMAVAGVV